MYEKRIQKSVDNTVNDLCYEIKVENRVKDKITPFIKQNIAFLFETKIYVILEGICFEDFFKIFRTLIASDFFLPRQILKNIDMPRQKLID